jgi:hypothetical protein
MLTIAGHDLKLTVYRPDAKTGYYRGSRFDWSGQIARAEWKGHTFFGEWQTPHDPAGHDHVVGPAEEFSMEDPPGHQEAAMGESFLKIGVGLLKKRAELYRFFGNHSIAQSGTWDVANGDDWVEFRQALACGDFAYGYTKRVAIAKNGSAFAIAHTLKNTGRKPLNTTHYCHNFVIIDDEPIGPAYKLTFAFDCAIAQQAGAAQVAATGKELTFPAIFADETRLYALLKGGLGTADQNRFSIENTKSGAGLRIIGDQPTLKFVVYAEKTAVCPEAFIRIDVPPGSAMMWETRYEFFLANGKS